MKQLLSILCCIVFSLHAESQEACEVKLKDIAGTYSGDCVDGKANGNGKSKGTDEYQGLFKNGYPEGKGMYTWKDGHYFIGFFKKGKKEGRGDMYYESANGEDSVISGYWRKDEYVGQYEKEWTVENATPKIGRVEGRRVGKSGSTITFTLQQISNATSFGGGSFLPTILSENVMAGTYETKNYQALTNSTIVRYQQVRFPLKLLITFTGNETAEFTFNEPGEYVISLNLTQ